MTPPQPIRCEYSVCWPMGSQDQILTSCYNDTLTRSPRHSLWPSLGIISLKFTVLCFLERFINGSLQGFPWGGKQNNHILSCRALFIFLSMLIYLQWTHFACSGLILPASCLRLISIYSYWRSQWVSEEAWQADLHKVLHSIILILTISSCLSLGSRP